MLRLFVCVWIPDELKNKIISFQHEMQKLPIKAKFVEPENLHLTVTFLGDKNESELNLIIKKLNDAVSKFKKFTIKMAGLKVIPNESYVRVLGLNVSDGNLTDLTRRVAESLGGKYYEASKLTLCRVKYVHDKRSLGEFIERNMGIKIGEFEVKSLNLVKSTLTRRGPIYETLYEAILQKN